MIHLLASSEHRPDTIFTWIWIKYLETKPAWFTFFNFDNEDHGQLWFEAMCFSVLAAVIMILLAALVTPKYRKVPRGLQNVLELSVDMLRKFFVGMIGPHGEKYVGYLGTLFLFIFVMNMMGIIPGFRAPTMMLSTTLALGLSTFFYVQGASIRANGLLGHFKHLCGPVVWMAPLMLFVEIIGELAKPMSLSLRLYGNIFGEDMVIENFMALGGWLPLQFPMLLFAIFTSFLQAFIFTSLSSIYIALLTAHEH